VNVLATGVPPGLGEPVYDRLDADLAYALMSINAVKAVEIGDGSSGGAARQHRARRAEPRGLPRQSFRRHRRRHLHRQDIRCSIALKPTSSITIPGKTIDSDGNATEMRTTGRHDPASACAPRPSPRPWWPLVLMDHWLRHRAQNADVKVSTPRIPAARE